MGSAFLSALQRRTPPQGDYSGRYGLSEGGSDAVAGLRQLRPDPAYRDRYDPEVNDDGIRRDRFPFYEADRFIPPGEGLVNWTAAGPRRPELHMRQTSYRREAGSSNTRFPFVPESPTTGLHTQVKPGTGTIERFYQTAQMRPGKQNVLVPGQYSGQTYSQTTRIGGSPR
jgi:hypothetical protein